MPDRSAPGQRSACGLPRRRLLGSWLLLGRLFGDVLVSVQCAVPEGLELIAQGAETFRAEPVDPARAGRTVDHQSSFSEDLQVLGHRWAADRQLVGDLADGARPLGEARDDGAPGGVPQCFPAVAGLVSVHERKLGLTVGSVKGSRTASGHSGSRTPGLQIPCGSRRSLTARSTSTPSAPTSRSIQGRWSAPTAWWWVSVPPAASRASVAARLAVSHCWIGRASSRSGSTVTYSEAPVA